MIAFESLARDILEAGDDDECAALRAACEDSGDCPDLSAHEQRFSWVAELADAVGWAPAAKYQAPFAEHINVKEARAYRTLIRRASGNALCHGTRRMGLLDSAVVRGATAKGRSFSWRLNAIIRPTRPEVLAANLAIGTLPIASKHNPADAPTREGRVRRRAAALPELISGTRYWLLRGAGRSLRGRSARPAGGVIRRWPASDATFVCLHPRVDRETSDRKTRAGGAP